MTIRRGVRLLVAAVALLVPLAAIPFVTTSAAGAQEAPQAPLVQTLTYDISQAEEFAADWEAGAAIWNETVQNVRLEKAAPGGKENIRVLADDHWPRAQVTSLGNGTVWMGRTAVNDGYKITRIAAHELGHILGLPDRRTGLCEDLMSGSSAPISCQNDHPNAAESAEVESNFSGSGAALKAVDAYVGGYDNCYVY